MLKTRHFILFLVLITLLEIGMHFGTPERDIKDIPQYIQSVSYYKGESPILAEAPFAMRALPLYLASLLPFRADISFYIMTAIFWVASAVMLFYFTKLITNSEITAFIAGVLFTTSVGMLVYNVAQIDPAVIFFFLLASYFIYVFRNAKDFILWFSGTIYIIIIINLGIACKEAMLLILVYLCLVELSKTGRLSLKDINFTKLILIISFTVAFYLVLPNYIGSQYTAIGYFSRLGRLFQLQYLTRIPKTLFVALGIGWLYILSSLNKDIWNRQVLFIALSTAPILFVTYFHAFGTRTIHLFILPLYILCALSIKSVVDKHFQLKPYAGYFILLFLYSLFTHAVSYNYMIPFWRAI